MQIDSQKYGGEAGYAIKSIGDRGTRELLWEDTQGNIKVGIRDWVCHELVVWKGALCDAQIMSEDISIVEGCLYWQLKIWSQGIKGSYSLLKIRLRYVPWWALMMRKRTATHQSVWNGVRMVTLMRRMLYCSSHKKQRKPGNVFVGSFSLLLKFRPR